jgi:hypothetical protein
VAHKHKCPICFNEMDCDAYKSNVVIYKPYKETVPLDSELMGPEEFKRMKESLLKKKEPG